MVLLKNFSFFKSSLNGSPETEKYLDPQALLKKYSAYVRGFANRN